MELIAFFIVVGLVWAVVGDCAEAKSKSRLEERKWRQRMAQEDRLGKISEDMEEQSD